MLDHHPTRLVITARCEHCGSRSEIRINSPKRGWPVGAKIDEFAAEHWHQDALAVQHPRSPEEELAELSRARDARS